MKKIKAEQIFTTQEKENNAWLEAHIALVKQVAVEVGLKLALFFVPYCSRLDTR